MALITGVTQAQIGGTPRNTVTRKGQSPMSRRTAQWFVIATLALASFTTACTRSDATGPSADQTAPSFEGQGANN
jgi:hypothetical protein